MRRWLVGVVFVGILLSGCSSGSRMLAGSTTSSAPPASSAAPPASSAPTRAKPPHLAPVVAAEIRYVKKYWLNRNVARYGDLGANDCANFTSQALIARGWTQTNEWNHTLRPTGNSYSPAWISSTAMMRYLGRHPELATAIAGDQLSRLRVGDIAQFDYDNSGDRDHTAVVTRIVKVGGNTHVYVAAHTTLKTVGYEYRSVNRVRHMHGTEGTVYYWHLKG